MPDENEFTENKIKDLKNTMKFVFCFCSYYRVQTGEVLDGRYNVFGYTGQVDFSPHITFLHFCFTRHLSYT